MYQMKRASSDNEYYNNNNKNNNSTWAPEEDQQEGEGPRGEQNILTSRGYASCRATLAPGCRSSSEMYKGQRSTCGKLLLIETDSKTAQSNLQSENKEDAPCSGKEIHFSHKEQIFITFLLI